MDLRIRNIILFITDAIIINLSLYVALLLRFDANIPPQYTNAFLYIVPLITLVTLISMLGCKLYNRVWEYASIGEAGALLRATSLSMLIVVAAIYTLNFPTLPRSVYIITWFLMTISLGASRLSWRVVRVLLRHHDPEVKKVLIVGAGDAGALLAREIKNNFHLNLKIIGFIDDDQHKRSMMLHNLPIMGSRADIPSIVEQKCIDEIIIAMPSVPGQTIREIVDICKQTPVSLKILPNIYPGSNGNNIMTHLRDVQMEDLLGREPVKIDLVQICGYLQGKTVLVTGGGGSIGSELCRQIAGFKPRRLVIAECSENNLFDIEMELKNLQPDLDLAVELVDVRNRRKLDNTFKTHRPQVIFHAAAFKHVPMMERHPEEALHNNVIGTRNAAEMADKYQAETFILISTDKAVNPSSVMGATKRIAELIIKDLNQTSSTRFAAVRFGNVLGSRGSVIPTFMKQIERGGPVTVTHPEMRRFFMTIPEAVELVIQAGALATGGEIFVLDMGDPVKIDDLARDLIKLSGYEPGRDIEISYTGIRPGEKLYEELFLRREEMAGTRHERIFISTKELDNNYNGINKNISVVVNSVLNDRNQALKLIKTLVPEYQKPDYGELKSTPAGEVIYLEERDKKAKRLTN